MSYHVHKDEIQLAWLDNRDTVKHMIRQLTRRVENEILRVLDDEFTAAVAKGEVVELLPGSDELRALYVSAVNSELGDVPKIDKATAGELNAAEIEALENEGGLVAD